MLASAAADGARFVRNAIACENESSRSPGRQPCETRWIGTPLSRTSCTRRMTGSTGAAAVRRARRLVDRARAGAAAVGRDAAEQRPERRQSARRAADEDRRRARS